MNYYVDFVLLALLPLAFKWHESLIPRIDSYEQYSQIYHSVESKVLVQSILKYQFKSLALVAFMNSMPVIK